MLPCSIDGTSGLKPVMSADVDVTVSDGGDGGGGAGGGGGGDGGR